MHQEHSDTSVKCKQRAEGVRAVTHLNLRFLWIKILSSQSGPGVSIRCERYEKFMCTAALCKMTRARALEVAKMRPESEDWHFPGYVTWDRQLGLG